MRERITISIAISAACLFALELIARLLAPAAPSLDTAAGRTSYFGETFYIDDPDLLVRMRPGLRTDFAMLRPGTSIPVEINSAGFRGPEWEPPDPRALRVLVFGDSVTFGLSIALADTWPAVLESQLRAEIAPRRLQVRNLGVPGYSTTQGRMLFEQQALAGDFEPDVVVFAFGFNDSLFRPMSDREALTRQHALAGWASTLLGLAGHSRLLSWFLRDAEAFGDALRVPQTELSANLAAVAAGCAKIGADLVLADASLTNGYARAAFDAAAQRTGARVLHFRDALAAAAGVPSPTPWPAQGRVRIEVDTHHADIKPAPDGRPTFYALATPDPAARAAHVRLPLDDAGRDGDLVAQDGVWSCVTPLWPAGSLPQVAFSIPSAESYPAHADPDVVLLNSLAFADVAFVPPTGDEPGTWRVSAPNRPPWRALVLDGDMFHTNEQGARVLGEAVATVLRDLPRVQPRR